MSEQTSQTDAFVPPAYLGDMRVYDIGATTLANCHSMGYFNAKPSKKYQNKKPDLLVVSNDGRIVLYLESKGDGVLTTTEKVDKAYEQEFEAAKDVKSSIFAIRDSGHTYWYNPQTGNEILDEEGKPLQTHLEPVIHPVESERLLRRISSSINSKNDRLISEDAQNPTDLARQVHQKLFTWKSTSPSTALYTFVEIFLFKYLSDLGILTGVDSFSYLMSLYEDNPPIRVLKSYMSGGRKAIIGLFPRNVDTDDVMGTTVINDTVFHEDVGDADTFREILELFQDYEDKNGKFINISPDFKSQLFESFLKEESDKKRMGQFFTPLKIVRNMVRTVDIKEGMSICDPACGVAKFLLEPIRQHADDYFQYDPRSGKVTSKIKLTGFDRYSEDNGDKTIILAKANALIYFSKFLSENPSKECAKSLATDVLNNSFMLLRDSLGTLANLVEEKYDLILANPPYLVNGSKDTRSKAEKFAKVTSVNGKIKEGGVYKWGGVGIEAMFLEWIVRSLKPGGRASVIVPDGILRNANDSGLRGHISEECIIESIISLPVNSFFNTDKKTYIVNLLRKRKDTSGTMPRQSTPVFMYICGSIGETLDVYRFDDPDNDDLTHAVDCYNVYRRLVETSAGDETIMMYLSSLPDDIKARLRIIDAEEFLKGSWVIEDYWSEDEKIELGLRIRRETLTPARFSALLQETIKVMDDYAKELSCLG